MKSNLIEVEGLKVNVLDSQRKADKTLVFIHGNSLSLEFFVNQFSDNTLNKNRLIAIDLPGHGKSGKATNPSEQYSIPGLASIVVKVLHQLKIETPILIGHSLGGHLANYIAKQFEGVKAIGILGTPPLGLPPEMDKAFLPNPILELAFKGNLTEEEGEKLARNATYEAHPFVKEIKSTILNTDPDFRDNIAASIGEGKLINELEFIQSFNKPYAIWHAEKDSLISLDYLKMMTVPNLWKNKIQIIENVGHMAQMEAPEEFNNLLNDFVNSLH